MNFLIRNKWCLGWVILLGIIFTHSAWAYSSADAMRLRTQIPVVDGSMPPDILAIQKRGVLRVGIYNVPVPPFTMVDAKGNWTGVEIDFGQMVATEFGVKLQIVPTDSYDDLITLITENKIDMAAGISILPIRQIKVSFSNPYYIYHPHLVVNRLAASQRGWTTPALILSGMQKTTEPLRVGVFAGSAVAQVIKQNFPNLQVVMYQDRDQSFLDVANGKIFASVGASPLSIQDFLNHNPQAALRAQDIEVPQIQDLLGVAIPWQSFHLRAWLNIYIEYLKQNGVREQLAKKYGY
jgi:polar amino acid transport system substrate-binding protein